MIKVVLVDDERPALRGLEHLLKAYPEISITGMYTNPLQAIDEIGRLKPQVVFMDVNMPQLRGIDVASRMLDLSPDTEIVFVTAYGQYAVEAFELHALDYVLKPVSKERFDKTIRRIIKKERTAVQQKPEKKFKLQTFGRFQAGWEGQEPVKWRSEKTKELFAFLLHNAGREVSKDEILEAVYCYNNIEKSVHQLYNGIYYIKKTLREYGVDRKQITIEGNYLLKLGEVEVDSLLFKQSIDDVKNLEAAERAESLYTADYFESMGWAWAEAVREKLSRQYIGAVIGLAEAHIKQEGFNRAEELLLKAFRKNPYIEDVSKLLLKVYRLTGRKSMAIKHYQNYEKVLKEELGVQPIDEIREILKKF